MIERIRHFMILVTGTMFMVVVLPGAFLFWVTHGSLDHSMQEIFREYRDDFWYVVSGHYWRSDEQRTQAKAALPWDGF